MRGYCLAKQKLERKIILAIDQYKVFETVLRQTDEVPNFVREYQFMPSRRWRIDFAWPDNSPRLAVEIEGGTWTTHSRHTKGSGYNKDRKKYNSMAIKGYFLLRFIPQDIESGDALDTIIDFFQVRKDMI